MHLLVRRLLEREQRVGAEVALVVALALAGEDRLRVVLLWRRRLGSVARERGLGRLLDGHARSILRAWGTSSRMPHGSGCRRGRRSRRARGPRSRGRLWGR